MVAAMTDPTKLFDGPSARQLLKSLEADVIRATEQRMQAERHELSKFEFMQNLAPMHREHERGWLNEAARTRGRLMALLCQIDEVRR